MWEKSVRWFPGRRGGPFVRLCPSSWSFSCDGCRHDFWLMFNFLEEPLLTWNSPVPQVAAALRLTQARITISRFHLTNSQHVSFSVFLDAIIRLSLVSAHLHLLVYTCNKPEKHNHKCHSPSRHVFFWGNEKGCETAAAHREAEDLQDLQSSVATQQKDDRLHDNEVWITDTTTDTVVGMSPGSVSTQQQMVCVQV